MLKFLLFATILWSVQNMRFSERISSYGHHDNNKIDSKHHHQVKYVKDYTSRQRNYLLFHSNPKDLLKRKFMMTRPSRKAQILTNNTSVKNSLDSLIQTAIASSGSNTTIVIINQAPALTPKLVDMANEEQNNQNCTQESFSGDGKNVRYGMTLEDIPGILNITESIGKLYDAYFKIFPETSAVLKDESKKSFLDNTANILSFYGKLKNFVMAVWNEKDILRDEIQIIRTNITTLQTSELEMLRFFGLESSYTQMKIKSAPYEAFDPKFNSYYMDMVDITTNFQINVQRTLQIVVDLDNYTQLFLKAVDQLRKIGINESSSEFINILSKIDTVLMFMGTILELRVELEATVKNSQIYLKALASERENLKSLLQKICNLADYYSLQNAETQSILNVKGENKIRSMMFLGVAFWMFY